MAVRGAAGGWLWKPGARGDDSGDTPAPEVGAKGRAGRAAAAGAQVALSRSGELLPRLPLAEAPVALAGRRSPV